VNQNELCDRVRKIISTNRYLTMATAGDRNPWIAPLAYSVEPDYSFVYYSAQDSTHSLHIHQNPTVACAIFDSRASSDDADGIQFSAKVEEVHWNHLPGVILRYFQQSFPLEEIRRRWERPIEEFAGLAIQRFYRIMPMHLYTIDLTVQKVDRRVEIDMNALKSIPLHR